MEPIKSRYAILSNIAYFAILLSIIFIAIGIPENDALIVPDENPSEAEIQGCIAGEYILEKHPVAQVNNKVVSDLGQITKSEVDVVDQSNQVMLVTDSIQAQKRQFDGKLNSDSVSGKSIKDISANSLCTKLRQSKRATRKKNNSLPDGETPERIANTICSCNSIVKSAITPVDTDYSQQWAPRTLGLPAAWDLTQGRNDTVIAIVDSGIDYTHPDLVANLWRNSKEVPNNGLDDDANGYIDDIHGINAISKTGDPFDDNSHGTHVAGIIGASGNNQSGTTGVNWNVKLLSAKFLSSKGAGSTYDAINALQYIIELKKKGENIVAINSSWGSYVSNISLKTALQQASDLGVVNVAAAGNDKTNIDSYPFYPASYQIPGLISVGATTRSDLFATNYSNLGGTVDIAAPGSDIYSTLPNSQYGLKSGTSMAAPQVTGLIGLMYSYHQRLLPQDARTLLLSSGRIISSLWLYTGSSKIPNAYAFLNSTPANLYSLKVQVKNPDGTPLAGAYLDLQKDGTSILSAKTDSSGSYYFNNVVNTRDNYRLVPLLNGYVFDPAIDSIRQLSLPIVFTAYPQDATAPVFTTHPESVEVIEGQSPKLSCIASGPSITYKWQKSEDNKEFFDISGATTNNIILPKASLSDNNTKIRCLAKNYSAEVVSKVASLKVYGAPVLSANLSEACSDQEINFKVSPFENSPAKYEIYKDFILSNQQVSAGIFSDKQGQSRTSFSVRLLANNNQLVGYSNLLQIEIAKVPSARSYSLANISVKEGDSYNSNGSQYISDATSYQWKKNGSLISGATSGILSLQNISHLDNNSEYSLIGYNQCGQNVETGAFKLSVSLKAPTITSSPSSLRLKEGQSGKLSVVATGSNLSYLWYKNGYPIPGSNSAELALSTVKLSQNNEAYYVEVTNSAGSVRSDSSILSIEMNPPVIIREPSDLTVEEYQGAQFSVEASGSNLSYQWYKNDQEISFTNFPIWNLGSVDSNSNNTTYQVKVSNSAASIFSRISKLNIKPAKPVILVNPTNLTVREGSPAIFSVSSDGKELTYLWYKNGVAIPNMNSASLRIDLALLSDDGAKIKVKVSNSTASIESTEAVLSIIKNPLSLTSTLSDMIIKDGDVARFSITSSWPSATYQWYRDGKAISEANQQGLELPALKYSDSGTQIKVRVSTPSESVESNPAVITILPIAPQILEVPQSVSINEGDDALIKIPVKGESVKFSWYKNGFFYKDTAAPELVMNSVKISDQGEYLLKAYNGGGEQYSNNFRIEVKPKQIAILKDLISTASATPGKTRLQIEASGNNLNYTWFRNKIYYSSGYINFIDVDNLTANDKLASYYVVVSSTSGSQISSEVQIAAKAAFSISKQPRDIKIKSVGSKIKFDLKISNPSKLALKYAWFKNGKPIPAANKPSLIINKSSKADLKSQFHATITDGNQVLNSNSVKITLLKK